MLIWIAVFEVNLEPLEKLYHFLVVVPCPYYHLIRNLVGQVGTPIVIGRLCLLEGVLILVCESFSKLQWAFVQLNQFIFAKVPVALFENEVLVEGFRQLLVFFKDGLRHLQKAVFFDLLLELLAREHEVVHAPVADNLLFDVHLEVT